MRSPQKQCKRSQRVTSKRFRTWRGVAKMLAQNAPLMFSCQQGIQCSGACQFGIVMCNNAISSGSLVARDRRGIFEDPAHSCRTKLGKCEMNLGQTCLEGGTFVRSHHFYLSIDQNAGVLSTSLGQHGLGSSEFFGQELDCLGAVLPSLWRSWPISITRAWPTYCGRLHSSPLFTNHY